MFFFVISLLIKWIIFSHSRFHWVNIDVEEKAKSVKSGNISRIQLYIFNLNNQYRIEYKSERVNTVEKWRKDLFQFKLN